MPKLMAKMSLAVAGCTAIALSMAACSSGAGSSVGSPATSNSPVTIMVAGQLQAASFQFPDMAVGAEAAAAKINASGGIDGHQIRIIQCNDGGDTAKATQ
jgi:hypothetical protein